MHHEAKSMVHSLDGPAGGVAAVDQRLGEPSGLVDDRQPPRNRVRIRWLAAAAVALVSTPAIALAAGWDAAAWFHHAWTSFTAVSPGYLVAALALQTLQLGLAATAWLGILRYAYMDADITFLRVSACYAAGVALNGFLPANTGTLVTVMMLVAVVAPATIAGVVAAAAVEKLFFAVIAGAVWLYLFVDVGGSFGQKFGFISAHPWATALTAVTVVAVLAAVGRFGWRRLRKTWEQARQGGSILTSRRVYARRVLCPQILSWGARLGVVAILLTAYGIPFGFQTVVRVIGGNSLGNVASLTPGGVGVNQGLSVVSLRDVARPADAAAYSVGQQLLTTAWNVVLAIFLVVAAFGWAGGRHLLRQSYDAASMQRRDG